MSRLCLVALCLLGSALATPYVHYKSDMPYVRMQQGTWEQNLVKLGEPTKEGGQHWALLVAGSNTWGNYRHQADVCHAYQVLKAHGLPDERIVVMMYDDIAYNEENPTPGQIINHPNGKDVYHGVPKDYTGKDVTPENFLKVMQGQDMTGIGSGKVIKSGPNDHLFINFVDHGAPGIIAFPESELKASALNAAIKDMYTAQQYKQMVIYLEACESGSMFQNLLPTDINVYVTTAANAKESSYACYLDKKRGTYLGDVYSVKWMEDSDKENLNMESLHKQYEIVKRETNTSHVTQYGNQKISKEKVAEFQGNMKTAPVYNTPALLNAVPSGDVQLAVLYNKLDNAKDTTTRRHVMNMIKDVLKVRSRIEGTMKSIVHIVTRDSAETDRLMSIKHDVKNFNCYEPLVDIFSQRCFKISQYDYVLRQLYVLVNLCEEGRHQATIQEAMVSVCDGLH